MSAAAAELLPAVSGLRIADSSRIPGNAVIVELPPVQYSARVHKNLVPIYQLIAGELTRRNKGRFYVTESIEPQFLAGQVEPDMRKIEYRGDDDWTNFVNATNHVSPDRIDADLEKTTELVINRLNEFLEDGARPIEIPREDHTAVWDI